MMIDPTTKTRAFAGLLVVALLFVGFGFYELGTRVFTPNLPTEGRLLTLSKDFLQAVEGGDITVPPPAQELPAVPKLKEDVEPLDPAAFSAASVLVKDVHTGTVLFAKDPYAERPIASITKLMSSLLLLEQDLDWTATTSVVSDDLIDTHMYAGDTYTIEELWQASLVGSSNKAIMTLADHVHWTREAFVARMSERARELGMGKTLFADPTGLDAENISTASDVSLLLAEALSQEKMKQTLLQPELNLYSVERNKSHHMWSTNWLLLGWIPHELVLHGGKTGYIDASGYNFAVRVEDAGGHVLDVVVLGATTHEARFTEARDAALWVFTNTVWPE